MNGLLPDKTVLTALQLPLVKLPRNDRVAEIGYDSTLFVFLHFVYITCVEFEAF